MEERQGYPPAVMQETADRSLLAQTTNPTKIIEEFSHRLRGAVFDMTDEKWVIKKGSEPKCNDTGINEIINEIFIRVNQNTIFSNLTAKEVENIILCFADNLAVLLAENVDEWEIKEENMTSLLNMCLDVVFFALKRGYEQGERKFLSKVTSQSEHIVHNQAPQRSMFDGIFNRGK